jgi:hypothetical protein
MCAATRSGVLLLRADITRLPFPTGSVAAIHAGAAIHCWPNPTIAVRASARHASAARRPVTKRRAPCAEALHTRAPAPSTPPGSPRQCWHRSRRGSRHSSVCVQVADAGADACDAATRADGGGRARAAPRRRVCWHDGHEGGRGPGRGARRRRRPPARQRAPPPLSLCPRESVQCSRVLPNCLPKCVHRHKKLFLSVKISRSFVLGHPAKACCLLLKLYHHHATAESWYRACVASQCLIRPASVPLSAPLARAHSWIRWAPCPRAHIASRCLIRFASVPLTIPNPTLARVRSWTRWAPCPTGLGRRASCASWARPWA